ncbi:MAG: hypothetical protein ACLFRX_06030 [Gemmatimonadota bacterium]
MRRIPLAMTAVLTLFMAEGQRAFFASMFSLGYDAIFPAFRADAALLAVLPLLVLLAPTLPLARWTGRAGAVAIAAAGAALFRLPMAHPAVETRIVGGALVLAFGALFLAAAVGYVSRRALTGGVVLGLVADQLLRLAGGSYDLSLQPGWLPVQAVLSLTLIALAIVWARSSDERSADQGLERRAGGLRLRAALALGALLFLDLHVLSLPPVVARWTGVGYALAAMLVAVAGAIALFASLVVGRPTLGRGTTLLLVATAAVTPILGPRLEGALGAGLLAGGHLAALLLITRTLDPASGRRGGATMTAGLAVLVAATTVYALTFFPASPGILDGAAPWLFAAVGLFVAGAFLLLPRPAELPSPPSPVPAWTATTAVVVAALALAAVARTPVPRTPDQAPAGADGTVRLVTWNAHYGFDERWTFDPAAMADALAAAEPDMVALQQVAVGAPGSYGIDLPRWLGHRLRLRDHFFHRHGRPGDAFLHRLEEAEVSTVALPPGGERGRLIRLEAGLGGTPGAFLALRLSGTAEARTLQITTALELVGLGPAVVLGNPRAAPDPQLTAALASAGFHDAFSSASGRSTFPQPEHATSIRVWVRGAQVRSADVLDATSFRHPPLAATLHFPESEVRSTRIR